MRTQFKHKLIAALAVIVSLFAISFTTANTASAEITYGGSEYASPGAGSQGVDPWSIIINQAMFTYNPNNGQHNQWIADSGTSRPNAGQLVIVQWADFIIGGRWQSRPMSFLHSLYTYSNSVTTRFYSDGSPLVNSNNWNLLTSMSGASQYPRVVALAGGYFGIGNNVTQNEWSTYGVVGNRFWFSGTFGGSQYAPGAGSGGGQWPGVAGQNAVGGGVLFRGDQILTTVRANVLPDVVLPTSERDDSPANRLATGKTVSINNVTTSTVTRSKSSTDDASYTIGVDYFSKAPYTYHTYAWAQKDKSYTTKTVENNYQSVVNITDNIPKGFQVNDVKVKTLTGKTLEVKPALTNKPGDVTTNVTKNANKDYASYYIEQPTDGSSGGKVYVQVISGDMTENVAAGKRNRAEVTISGKLIASELPKPNSKDGVGQVTNQASANQIVQRWIRAATSGAGTKPQPYTFNASNGFNRKDDIYNTTVNSNQVTINVQAYQLLARYMTLGDDYTPRGNMIAVDTGGGKMATEVKSDWAYPTQPATIPTPDKTTTAATSLIYDRVNGASKFGLDFFTGSPWSFAHKGSSGMLEETPIPNTAEVYPSVDSAAILNSGGYTATWYRNVVDLAGNPHSQHQITDFGSGETTPITVDSDTLSVIMGDNSKAVGLFYGQKLYRVNVKHVTTGDSDPAHTSFDENLGKTSLTPAFNTQGPVSSYQTNKSTVMEDYVIHEGESLNYAPQVLKIRDQSKRIWSLSPLFAQGVKYEFKSGTTPAVDNDLVFGTLALEYQRALNAPDRAVVTINPDKFTINTSDHNQGLDFTLDLSAVGGNKFDFMQANKVPGFDLKNYKYTVKILNGQNVVFSQTQSIADMQKSSDRWVSTLRGKLTSPTFSSGEKIPFQVIIELDKSALTPLNYQGVGTLPITIEQDESTDTPSTVPFKSFGYTASKIKVTNKNVTSDGQLSVAKDKLVVQTVATREPYTYIERYESWTLSIPKDLTTLTGYSVSGMYPISYGVDGAAGRGMVDFNDKFQIRYAAGLNADRSIAGYVNEKKGMVVDSKNPQVTLGLKTLNDESKDTYINGQLTRATTQVVPRVSVKEGSGEVSSAQIPDGTTYKNGGNRIFISDWISNVPSTQPIIFESKPEVQGLGVNQVTFSFEQNVTLSGYLHGHAKSATQATDAILMQPVDRASLNPLKGFGYNGVDNMWLSEDSWLN